MIEVATVPGLGLALAIALLITAAAVPLARTLAARTGFYDYPVGFKAHAMPTPYLGGVAVVAGSVAAVALFGDLARFAPLLGCVIALHLVGTADDRWLLPVLPRVAAEVLVASVLWATDLGWSVFDSDAANLGLTVVWVVGLVNAFNMMDNLDGAAGTVAAASAAGAGGVALVLGDEGLALVAFAVVGACVGFLPYNLARPSRIFLGDGGSMPLGLLIATLVMALPDRELGLAAVAAFAPLVGLVMLDMALVVVSRSRRGAPILEGARDHLAHRLHSRLGAPTLVATSLLMAQALLGLLALALAEAGRFAILNVSVLCLFIALGTILALEGLVPTPLRAERSG